MPHESPPTITVLYFAAASTATRLSSEEVPLPRQPFRLSELGEILALRHPAGNLREILEISRWSIDAEMIDDPETIELRGGEEVAIICPVSGG
jgi:molybdopterin converting factor small subunit